MKNSLAKKNPKLTKQWHPTKNGNLTPNDVTYGSNKEVWWQCEKGHIWKAKVNLRSKGSGCHICSGYKIYKGYNDLLTKRPEMKEQWDFEKNKDVDIYSVSDRSKKIVWWKCKNGHNYRDAIFRRCDRVFCSICYDMHGTSFPEQAVYYYIKSKFKTAKNRYKYNGKIEIDVFIPELNIGIEYDGKYFHSSENAKKKDRIKEEELKKNEIKLIRIKEEEQEEDIKIVDNNIYYKIRSNTAFSKSIEEIFRMLHINDVNIDIDKDMYNILESYNKVKEGRSLFSLSPEISKQWNEEKNKPLTPDKIDASSSQKVWWKCSKGHEWKTSPNKRYSEHTGCPYCANKKVLVGYNDLETINPKLAKEWHPTKNGDLKPTQFTMCSGKKVWWQCEKGHEWIDSIAHRKNNRGCKYCNKRALIIGKNDMISARPDLIKEWDFKENGELNPYEMFKGSEKKVWWICNKGHKWKTMISDRVNGNNCPYYGNQKLLKGFNDVETLKPELATIWHPTKNGDLQLSDFFKCSEQKVWWKCENGHEFQSSIYSRYMAKHLCKYCYKEKNKSSFKYC